MRFLIVFIILFLFIAGDCLILNNSKVENQEIAIRCKDTNDAAPTGYPHYSTNDSLITYMMLYRITNDSSRSTLENHISLPLYVNEVDN
jgi:hypothetical protein